MTRSSEARPVRETNRSRAPATRRGDASITGLTPRGQRTRASLIAAARKVFERDGFFDARVTDITATAGVAHGTFYTYFNTKEAVFRDVIADVRDQVLKFVQEYPSDAESALLSDIERAHLHYLETYRDNAALIETWLSVAMMDEAVNRLLVEARQVHVARVERTIRMLQLHGRADAEIDPRGAAHAMAGMLTRFAAGWFAEGDARELDEGARQLTRLWTNAIGLKPR